VWRGGDRFVSGDGEPGEEVVCLDGGTPETNDSIRRKGVFKRALRGLELLAAEHHSLTVNSVLIGDVHVLP
jgi:MoaA/NifB/PqqE/SkfB family radical SAM enzyme